MAGTLLNNTIDKTDANQQLASTINQGGLLMRMAQNKGQQTAAGRGLMNSSIGSEASQRAIVDAALPLSQQNTQFAQTKDINQQQADLTAKRDETQQGYNKENMGLQFGYSTKLNDQQNTFTAGQNALDRNQQITMSNLQQQNQLGLLDAQGKQDLAQLEAQFKNQSALNQQQNTFSAGQSALDRQQQTNLTNLNFQNQSALNNQQNTYTTQRDSALFGYDQKNKATDFANQLQTMSEQQKNDLAKLNNQNAQQTALAAQQQQYALTNTAKQVAANTQGMYLEAINGLTSTFGDQVAAIQASAMKAADKTTAVNSLINSQNAMLKFYQNTYQNMSTIKDDWINVDVNTLPSGTISNIR